MSSEKRKTRTSIFILFCVASLTWINLCQLIFLGIQHSLGQKVVNTIQNQFRQELDFSNFHFLSRGLIDYEHSGSINCTLLKRLNPEIIILNQRQTDQNCDRSSFWLNGESFNVNLKALNGDNYSLAFVSRNDFFFYACLWTFRIVGLLLLGSGIYIYYLSRRTALLKIENERILAEERQMIAKQVAHDIRSPLSALIMVTSTLKDLPEDRRILIRNATQRINDIANDLLQKGQRVNPKDKTNAADPTTEKPLLSTSETGPLSIDFVPALVDLLVSEKRMQYREYAGLEIEIDLKNSFGAFAKVNSNELKRVISNLVNNSIDAFDNHQGKVTVGVRKIEIDKAPQVEIFVKDNGKGIPSHLINRLGQAGMSFGKTAISQSGSGLGIYHAKRTAESFSGSLQIDSTEGIGTIVRLMLPLAEGPTWFASKLDLTGKKFLVSLDDDISIHQIWADRLQSLSLGHIEHIKFQSGEAFEKYVNSNINKLGQTLFLIDYELLHQHKTGLALIEELGIEKYSVLVTSRYEESNIQERASSLNLHLLPKALAGFVPILMARPKEKYDWVLLDDDELVHMSWAYAAKESNKMFLGFRDPREFDAYKNKLDLESRIYIDSNLANGVKGENIAKMLFDEGFKNLYLATGYAADQFPSMHFIKNVVGKEPPITKKI